MSKNRPSGQGRVVRTRRSPDHSAVALAGIDRRLLDVLCTHRVVTQSQLQRLFPTVPERTLRYRTRRLHDLRLAGRSRPYRDHGSAPHHHWPTRRADCLMRGEPTPRGGERKQPNPVFLAHAAALTELYVAVATSARAIGVKGMGYRREGEARETFKDGMRERALAPDALLGLLDEHDRELWAFVEIDLGTMSHTRLRAKAELYAAYAASDAWREHHAFLPALLFLTTTDARARKFLNALTRALSYGPHQRGRRAFVAGASGIVWTPDHLLTEPCLSDLDGNTGRTLSDVLNTARAPYERALAREREQREAEEQQRCVLREDPKAMRKHLDEYAYPLRSYAQELGPLSQRTVELLTASTAQPSPDERQALRAIARDLDQALLEPCESDIPSPGDTVRSEIALLAEHYRTEQTKTIKALDARHGEGPSLRRAWAVLRDGGLLDPTALSGLPSNAEHDAAGRSEQHERCAAYFEWREQAARQLARKAGPLGRLTHRPEDFYSQLDREQLRVCTSCGETIYPSTQQGGGGYRTAPQRDCHYCRGPHGTLPYDSTSTASKESEAQR
jgi:hypothetical protein